MSIMRRILLSTGSLSLFIGLLTSCLFAMEPPRPGMLEGFEKDGSLADRQAFAQKLGNHLVAPRLVQTAQQRLECLRAGKKVGPGLQFSNLPNGMRGMPTTGTIHVLALLIDFSDYPHTDDNAYINARLFGNGVPEDFPLESLRAYYSRSSYGLLDIQGSTLGWYRPSVPRSQIAKTDAGRDNLIKEAITYFDQQGTDFSQFDNDGDGAIDYFLVFWTGPDQGWSSFWWGYQTQFSDSSFTVDGKRLRDYSWQWETNPSQEGGLTHFSPNTCIHETGHALGLPDYYDYNSSVGPRGGVGGLDMMDGNYGDHNCFSKFLLGWLTPTVYDSPEQAISLRNSAENPEAALIIPSSDSTGPFSEYFMLQTRTRVGNDSNIPGQGMLLWHVDAGLNLSGRSFLFDNSYTAHKLLRLSEADGQESIERGQRADSGDFFNSGNTFGPATTPNSSFYSGYPSTLGLKDFSAAGSPMTATLFAIPVDATAPTGAPTAPTDAGDVWYATSATFNWTAGDCADPESGLAGYILQVVSDTAHPETTAVYSGRVGTATRYKALDLEVGKTYYARVRCINGYGLAGNWSPFSDGIRIEMANGTLSAADVELPSLTFSSGSAYHWERCTDVFHSGGSAMRSTNKVDSSTAEAFLTLMGPCKLDFWCKVSSEANFDFLYVYVDGSIFGGISGERDWVPGTVSLDAGLHVVKFAYVKDGGVSEGQDTAWIDDFSITYPVVKGDLDRSWDVNICDLLTFSLYRTGTVPAGTAPFLSSVAAADLDNSGTADATDFSAMNAWLLDNSINLAH